MNNNLETFIIRDGKPLNFEWAFLLGNAYHARWETVWIRSYCRNVFPLEVFFFFSI